MYYLNESSGYHNDQINIGFSEVTMNRKGQKSFLVADLQHQIMKIVTQRQCKQLEGNLILTALTDDLQSLMKSLQKDIEGKDSQQVLKIRIHQLAIAKLLVFTHGKSDFRLVVAHFNIGKAYLRYGCFEQSINHLTIASTKNSKMGEIKQTKIYNSYILTTISQSYFNLQSYEYSLEMLNRAYQIQSSQPNQKYNYIAQETLELLAMCHLKLKNYKEAVQSIEKLIKIMGDDFTELEASYFKLVQIKRVLETIQDDQNDENQKKLSRINFQEDEAKRSEIKKKSQQSNLRKIVDFLNSKLDNLIIQYDKKPVKALLNSYQSTSASFSKSHQNTIEYVAAIIKHLDGIIRTLVQELKFNKIFKFKIFAEWECINSAIEQELKKFLKQYQEQREGAHNFLVLSLEQKIQIYNLLVNYCAKFNDSENQLLYLNYLREIYEEDPSISSKMNLLKLKRNLAMLFSQRRMQKNTMELLYEIKNLQVQLYGNQSEIVKKTDKLIKIVKADENENDQNIEYSRKKIDKRKSKSRVRKTVNLNPRESIFGSKKGSNDLVL